MDFFISRALSETTHGSSLKEGSPYSLIIMLIVFGLIFYFAVLQPQRKRIKIHKELINSISEGDEILTTGGLIGRVVKISKNDCIAIAVSDTSEVIIKKDYVSAILPKGTMNSI